MGYKGNDISSSMENGLPDFGDNKFNKAKRLGKSHGGVIHDNDWVHNSKMGETIKIALNVAGISAYILGILTNLNNFISVILGIAGFLFAIIRCAKGYEDYRFRKAERREKEHNVNKYIRKND